MKTDDLLIVTDAVTATLFGLLGIVAALAVLICGAWWHLFTFAMCGVVMWESVSELIQVIRKTNKT